MSATAFQRKRRELAVKKAAEEVKGNDGELQQLRERAASLGIPNASKLGAKKLLEAIAKIEAGKGDE